MSTTPVCRPRVTASRATPAPVTPPPMTSTSSSSPAMACKALTRACGVNADDIHPPISRVEPDTSGRVASMLVRSGPIRNVAHRCASPGAPGWACVSKGRRRVRPGEVMSTVRAARTQGAASSSAAYLPGSTMTSLAPQGFYEAYIFDMDGTIYLGDQMLPGAIEVVEGLRARGVTVRFLSNNPTKDPHQYAEKLTRLGLPTPAAEIVNTVTAMVDWLRTDHPGAVVYPIAEEPLIRALTEAGIE